MENITITALICATMIWLVERVMREHLRVEKIKRAETKEEVQQVAAPDPIPADLAQMAMQESADWARQDAVKAMYELYEATRDWNVVRAVWHPDRGSIQ